MYKGQTCCKRTEINVGCPFVLNRSFFGENVTERVVEFLELRGRWLDAAAFTTKQHHTRPS